MQNTFFLITYALLILPNALSHSTAWLLYALTIARCGPFISGSPASHCWSEMDCEHLNFNWKRMEQLFPHSRFSFPQRAVPGQWDLRSSQVHFLRRREIAGLDRHFHASTPDLVPYRFTFSATRAPTPFRSRVLSIPTQWNNNKITSNSMLSRETQQESRNIALEWHFSFDHHLGRLVTRSLTRSAFEYRCLMNYFLNIRTFWCKRFWQSIQENGRFSGQGDLWSESFNCQNRRPSIAECPKETKKSLKNDCEWICQRPVGTNRCLPTCDPILTDWLKRWRSDMIDRVVSEPPPWKTSCDFNALHRLPHWKFQLCH
jgi:hypothetical protein